MPPYLAYIAGVSIEELSPQGTHSGHPVRGRVLAAALAFVAGFSTVFVLLGATASWLGQAVSTHLDVLGYWPAS